MIHLSKIVLPASMEVVEFLPISDLHIGSAAFDENVIKDFVKWVLAADNRFTGIGGDIGNFALPTSKSNYWAEKSSPKEQIAIAIRLLEPIKDRILYIIDGNHDDRLFRSVGISPAEQVAVRLDLEDRYSEGIAFIALQYGHKRVCRTGTKAKWGDMATTYIYAEHGTGGGGSIGGKLNRAKKPADAVLANIYVMGHGHGQVFGQDNIQIPYTATKTPTITTWYRMYSMCAPMVAKEIYAYIMATGNSPVGHTGKYTLYSYDEHIEYTATTRPFE